MCAFFVGLSAFGQGFLNFSSGKSQIWNGFTTPGVYTLNSDIDVSFLWSTTDVTPLVEINTGLVSTPTSGLPDYTSYTAWSAILGDLNYQLAENYDAANAVVVVETLNNGAITSPNVALSRNDSDERSF